MTMPYLDLRPAREGDEPGYRVGSALDDLVGWAREHGASEEELRERLEEAFDRYDGEGEDE